MECDGTVAICCIVLLADAVGNVLLKLEFLVVGVEFSGIEVAELLGEDSRRMTNRDGGSVEVDDDNVDERAT